MTTLSKAVWDRLVRDHLRRAFLSQWIDDKTDAEMDYAGERLIAAKWTVEQATWCVKHACGTYTRLEGPLAMICRVNEGRRDRDGNIIGGWRQSKSHAKMVERNQYQRLLEDCQKRVVDDDTLRQFCGTHNYCQDCDKRDSNRVASGVSRGENPQGGFKRVGELLPPEARNA